MTRQGLSVHLDEGDEFRARYFPATVDDAVFPELPRPVKSVGCVVHFGDVPVFFRSPAQICEAIEVLRAAADKWQDELFHAMSMGSDYVLAPEETPASVRDAAHDDGCDDEAAWIDEAGRVRCPVCNAICALAAGALVCGQYGAQHYSVPNGVETLAALEASS